MSENTTAEEDAEAPAWQVVFTRDAQHRLVYAVEKEAKTVKVLRMWTHYE